MAKAAVRGLEATTEFIYEKTGHYPYRAGVTGASKRGWTTWLAAAVDYERVTFMAPVYFDELNMVENIHHHYRSLGGYTYAFADYWYAGITEFLDDEAVESSRLVMDVLTFKDRYEKFQLNYIINAGNDEFFALGNPLYFLDQLSPKTLLRVIPNQGHSGVNGGLSARNSSGRSGHELPFQTNPAKIEAMDSRRSDSLWESLEAIFTASMWYPELIPEIKTIHLNEPDKTTIKGESTIEANRVRSWKGKTNARDK